jgi:DNA-binding beta-propeller fold protein YncE
LKVTTTLVVLSLCVPSTTAAGTLKLYWSDIFDTVITRSNLDGTQAEAITRTPGGVVPNIAFDPVNQRVYWPSPVAEGIQSANYDGSDVETVITGIATPTVVAVDAVNRKAYWVDYDAYSCIWRSNLDGTDREKLASDIPPPRDIQVDPLHGYYYVVGFFGEIYRTSFDGTHTDSTFFPRSPRQIAIDPIDGYVYTTDSSYRAIIRMRLDLSEPTLWVTKGVSNPEGIVIDTTNGRVIWSNEGNSTLAGSTNISSINFAGSDQRIDFYPLWNEYAAALAVHLGIVEVFTPEPSALCLCSLAGIVPFLFRRVRG